MRLIRFKYFEEMSNPSGVIEQQQKIMTAASEKDPALDLLIPSSAHACQKCLVPLAAFTRIVAREIRGEKGSEGFRNLCQACFAGWYSTGRESKAEFHGDYEYFVLPAATEKPSEGSNWSVMETIALLECVEKFGVDSWKQVHRQFVNRTGINRVLGELAQKYLEVCQNNDYHLSFRRQTGNNEQVIIDRKVGRVCKPYNFFKNKTGTRGRGQKKFYNLLNKKKYLDDRFNPVNNFYGYIFKIFMRDAAQQTPMQTPETRERNARLAHKVMEDRDQFLSREKAIEDHLCQIYVETFCKQKEGQRLHIKIPEYFGKEETVSESHQFKRLKDRAGNVDWLQAIEELYQTRLGLVNNRARNEEEREETEMDERAGARENRMKNRMKGRKTGQR